MKSDRKILRGLLRFAILLLFLSFFAPGIFAQTPASPDESPEPQPSPTPTLEKQFFKNILRDQRAIWVSPFRMGGGEMRWVAPLSVASVGLIFTDRRTTRELREYHDQIPLSIYISKLATSTGYAAAAFYFIGRASGNRRAKETGVLAGEALIDSLIVSESIKGVTQRPRPLHDGGRGRFFTGGNSFPSGHAMAAWAFASVVANEYNDRRLVQFGAYGLATVVSAARFTGNRHFLSEVLVGSVIGYGIGQYVYRTHHRASPDEILETRRQSKLFPMIAPNYNPGLRQYGVRLAWNF
ncbi:MAG TPA: phosphatase PAP2 family protein [Pyrinomonadaceae bacterium]|jgi:membrane-associated phospholipid phosphatase